jgi:hypothetical protein
MEALRQRRLDPIVKSAGLTEVYSSLKEPEAVRYLIGAMQPIDPEVTKAILGEANRVRGPLSTGYPAAGVNASFDCQGSVTNDTHILAFSDVDLLAVNENFCDVETAQPGTAYYRGDITGEMRRVRISSVQILRQEFPTSKVDDSNSKAVKIEGGLVRRKVDVVPCNWWNTDNYVKTRKREDRGIKVFNNANGERIPNKPFLHNTRIEEKDSKVAGNLRRVVRLLKSLRYDANKHAGSEKVKISSYDIAGIAFNMSEGLLTAPKDQAIRLAVQTLRFLNELEADPVLRAAIEVPNRMRKVFCAEGATLDGLEQLKGELEELLSDVAANRFRSFEKLAEARIPY